MLYAAMITAVAATVSGGATVVSSNTSASPRVQIDTGELIGVTANGADAFKGIPYALPTHPADHRNQQ